MPRRPVRPASEAPPPARSHHAPPGEAELKARFAARGIPLTIQRRAILEELRRRADHPTAEGVYEAVARELPGLSRATVYRTLETLVELDLAMRICHPGSSARYDPKTWRHHHLICEGCGQVLDVELAALDALPVPSTKDTGFVVRDFSVQYTGWCAPCARNQAAHAINLHVQINPAADRAPGS